MVVLTILDLIMVMHQLDRENIYKYCERCNFQLDLKQQNFLVPGSGFPNPLLMRENIKTPSMRYQTLTHSGELKKVLKISFKNLN